MASVLNQRITERYAIYNGDSMDVMSSLPDDSIHASIYSPDELLVFRKPGEAEPARHPQGLTGDYAGGEQVPTELQRFRGWEGDQKLNRYSHWIWRRYASSVWDDIRIDRVLPFRDARDEDDEKHVHPLQLDVIERFIDLRTCRGERVLTPFMGVGSEVYGAVSMGRYGIRPSGTSPRLTPVSTSRRLKSPCSTTKRY
jgi:DNA modification methylase